MLSLIGYLALAHTVGFGAATVVVGAAMAATIAALAVIR